MTFDEMNDEELAEYLRKHLSFQHDWHGLLVYPTVERVRDSLLKTKVSIERQLVAHDKPGNEEWATRTKTLLHMVDGRLRQVELRFESGRSVGAWKACLHRVLEKVDELGSDELIDALEELEIPVGGLDLWSWLERRREKRAGYEVAA